MHLEPLKASGFSGDCNQRAGDVPLAMSQLTGHVDNLNRQMEILANRLESVLSAPEPIAGGADRSEVPHDPSCELGNALYQQAVRVNAVGLLVDSLIKRLEL